MHNNDSASIISLVATVLIAVALFLFLYMCPVIVATSATDTEKKGDIVLAEIEEEEFVDLLEPAPVNSGTETPTEAYLDQPEQNQSQPAPEGGTDLSNSGPQDQAPPVLQQQQPSPAKTKKEEPKPQTGQAQKSDEDRDVKRKVQNDVAGALTKGKNNASTSSTADEGASGSNTGQKTGTASVQGLSGSGWIIPSYSPVKSPVTGSINATVKIDKTGRVTSVVITGGTPPAATNATVCAAVKREISSRKFTRSNYTDAEAATAYITYRFK